MRAKLAYEVRLADKARIFAETESGALDYEGCFDASLIVAKITETLGRDPGPGMGDLVRVRDYEDNLYLAENERASVSLTTQCPCCDPVSEAEVQAFFRRLPELEEAMAWGDASLAVLLARRSRKLAPFRSLLRRVYAERWGFAFAAAWLMEGANETSFDALLRCGLGSEKSDPAFELALPSIHSDCGHDYRNEACETILAELDRGGRLVVSIAGAHYRPCLGNLAALIAEAKLKARSDAIITGSDHSASEERIFAYLSSTRVFLLREPCNPADRNAVAVMLHLPDRAELEHAGYLPRAVAAILAPTLSPEGDAYTAELFRLSEDGADIRFFSTAAASVLP
jgi:HIRAN domain.